MALIPADVGVPATAELVRRLEAAASSATREALAEEIEAALRRAAEPGRAAEPAGHPRRRRQRHGQDDDDRQARTPAVRARPPVLVGAADTFRAAADEQLEIWAERAGADFVGGSSGADPAAVAFDAVEAGARAAATS